MSQVASDSLLWIKNELDNTLLRARQSLESFVENRDEKSHLQECLDALHQVQGTLRIVEVYGAAMLAEEMEAVTKALAAGEIKEPDDAFEVLMRGMLQLPDYLERIVSGQRDVPLALLSLLNDLRSVRGESLLSESSLFAQSISDRSTQGIGAENLAPSGGDIVAVAKKLRPKFQSALLGWFKAGSEQELKKLSAISEELEQAATVPASFQLWWVVSGTLEALVDGGLEASVSLKQMLGQVDRQIKRLIDGGERVFETEPPSDLVNNLLYYIGKASSTGGRVTKIKESFGLGELMPQDEQLSEASEGLGSGPNINLMKTVSAAIKEDLARVKDTLDIFVRMGKADTTELSGPVELLKKVADTLGVLSLDLLREDIEKEKDSLDQIVNGKKQLSESMLMDIASSLIKVETSLDQKVMNIVVRDKEGGDVVESGGLQVGEADLRQVSSEVVRESIINLARVKDAIIEYIKNPLQNEVLRPIPPLIHQIQSGLKLLDIKRPTDLLESVRAYIQRKVFGATRVPDQNQLDRMADAIVSVEFFLETVQQGRGYPESMLENAEACVAALGFPVGQEYADETAEDEETVLAATPVEDAEATVLAEPTVVGIEVEESAQATPAAQEEAPTVIAPAAPKPAVAPRPDEVDPEIVEIFLEESQEEIASLRDHFPRWKQNSENREALSTVRRSFHTLKGSGRMVGAELIGEFAWSMENMLNRIIDQTIDLTQEAVDLIEAAIEALPELIEQLEVGTEPKVDVATMMEKAHAMSRGEIVVEAKESAVDAAASVEAVSGEPVAAEEKPAAPAAPETPAPSEPAIAPEKMDPVLYEIFSKEVMGHLTVCEEFLAEAEEKGGARKLPEEVFRALHTLNGSAGMAGVQIITEFVYPFERYCKNLIESKKKLSQEALAVLRDITVAVRKVLESLREGTSADINVQELNAKLQSLQADKPAPAAPAAEPAGKPAEETADTAAKVKAGEPQPAQQPAAPPKFVQLEELPGFDSDLASIFFEEAAEILEATDAVLHNWSKDHDQSGLVLELQRHLHTLKGGARMAGITPMGDLSHEIETLLTDVVDGRITVSTSIFSLLQRSADRLHKMLEQVSILHLVRAQFSISLLAQYIK